MGDPLRTLHKTMLDNGLLQDNAVDFDAFSEKMQDPAQRKKLYGFLESEQWGVHGYEAFEADYFQEKKNPIPADGGASGAGSSDTNSAASAQTAGSPFGNEVIETAAMGVEMAPSDVMAGAGKQEETTEILSEGQLMQTESAPRSSTAVAAAPIQQLQDTNFTGEESGVDAGRKLRAEREADFQYKEGKASRSPLRKGARELQNITMYGDAAAGQVMMANEMLAQQFGADWGEQLNKLGPVVEQIVAGKPPAEMSLPEAQAAIDNYNAIVGSEDYKKYVGGVKAQGKAQADFKGYAETNPEYAKTVARQKANEKAADESVGEAMTNWYLGKTQAVAAGLASIPRTLLQSVAPDAVNRAPGAGSAPAIIEGLGDWADDLMQSKAVDFPTGSDTDRPLWEPIAPFKGMEVVVDTKGRPAQAYRDGKEVEMTDEEIGAFVESNAGASAKLRFTGAKNAAFKLADTVADIYLMRAMGGGAKAGTVASSFATMHKSSYDEAVKDLGMTGGEAAQYALVSAGIAGLIEAYVGDIETNPVKLATAKAVGLKEARALVGKATPYDIAKAAFKPVVTSIAGENAEELMQAGTQNYINSVYNATSGSNFETESSMADIGETILLTTVATALTGGADTMKRGLDEYSKGALHAAVQNPAGLQVTMQQLVNDGVTSQEEAASVIGKVEQLSAVYQALPADMKQADKEAAVELELKKISVTDLMGESESTSSQQIVDNTAKDVDNEIEALVTGEPVPGTEDVAVAETVTEDPVVVAPEPVTETVEVTTEEVKQSEPITEEEIFVEPASKKDLIGAARVVPVKGREVGAFEEIVPDSRTKVAETIEVYAPGSPVTDEPDIAAMETEMAALRGAERTAAEQRVNEAKRAGRERTAQVDQRNNMLLDDAVNAGLSYFPRRVRKDLQPTDVEGFRQYLAEHLLSPSFIRANKNESFLRTIQLLAEEYVNDNIGDRKGSQPMSKRFDPQTVEDHIADAFLSGARVSQDQLASDLPAEMSEGAATRLAYSGQGAQGIDELAADIYSRMNSGRMDAVSGSDVASQAGEMDIANRIRDFIRENPSGPGAYVRESLNREEDAMSRFAGEEIPEADRATATEAAEKITFGLDANDEASLKAALDEYTDDAGRVEDDRLRNDYEAWDPFDNPIEVFQNLTPNAKSVLDEILRSQNADSSLASQESETHGAADTRGAADGPGEYAIGAPVGEEEVAGQKGAAVIAQAEAAQSPVEIEAAMKAVDEALATTPMPAQLTIPLIQEMRDDQVISNSDATMAIRYLNGQNTPVNKEAYDRVYAQRESLRIVPQPFVLVGPDRSGPVRVRPAEVQVRPDGTVLAAHAGQYGAAMRRAGGFFDPVTGHWSFPAGSESTVLAVMSEQSSNGEDQAADARSLPGTTSGASALLTSPGAILKRRRTKGRMKAAGSFSERLRIAAAENGPGISKQEKALRKTLIRLRRAFPGITIVTDTAVIDAKKRQLVAEGRLPTGRVLGFESEGVVYVDPRVATPETAVHELDHIWNTWTRENQPTLYAKGLGLMEGSDTLAAVQGSSAYAGLTPEQQKEEALARAIGQRGALVGNTSLVIRFKAWLDTMWMEVGRAFGFPVRDLRLRQFVDRQARTMLSGRQIMADTSARIREIEEQAEQVARFQIIGEIGARAIPGKQEGLALAGQMESDGKTPDEIWAATGWERGADGKWKTEIEYGTVLEDNLKSRMAFMLEDVFDAPRLYEAYPDLRDVSVIRKKEIPVGTAYVSGGNIFISANQQFGPAGQLQDIMVHEVQHLVQEKEGFARGGQPEPVMDMELRTAIETIMEADIAGKPAEIDEWLGPLGGDVITNADMLEEMGILQEFQAIKGKSRIELAKLLAADDVEARDGYGRLAGEVEARNASTREAEGTEFPISMTEDTPRVSQRVRFHAEEDHSVAKNMEDMGRDGEDTFVVTGWHRYGDGYWHYDPVPVATLRQDSGPLPATVGELMDWPAMAYFYPETMNLRLVEGTAFAVRDGAIEVPAGFPIQGMMIPLAGAIRKHVQETQGLVPVVPSEMTEIAPEEQAVFQGVSNADVRAGAHSTSQDADYGMRMLSATDLIRIELQEEGQTDRTGKIVAIAEALGLQPIDVFEIWERESELAGTGRLVLHAGRLNESESPLRRWAVRNEAKVRKWTKKKFTVRGLMPSPIYDVDQRRLNQTAALLKKSNYLMQHLERAMKETYGKALDENHWRMVDNVLRGTGDWDILPPAVYTAARDMRLFQDMISRELVRSGMIGGEMLLTVLENSGAAVTQAQMKNYQGVNIKKALAKLPFERTDQEHTAIADFIDEFGSEVGNYMYRSYKKHDDDEWADKVSPRVVAEARQFLIDDLNAQIRKREAERDARTEEIEKEIALLTGDIEAVVRGLNDEMQVAKARLEEIRQASEDYKDEKGKVNKTIERQFEAWQRRVKKFTDRAQKGEELVLEDFEVLDGMAQADFDRLMIPAKRIVAMRRKIVAMRKGQDNIQRVYDEKILETLYHQLANVDGEIKKILDKDKAPVTQLSRGLLGGKDMASFRGRKDIPEPIRELMGEYHDPRLNFAKSMYRTINVLQNQLFVTELRERFNGTLFFPRLTGDATSQIAAESSDSMAPLNGWYTTPEIKEVFQEYNQVPGKPPAWLNFVLRTSAKVKYGKTILSPVTHARNFFGNLWFVLNNAYDLRHASTARTAFRDAWGKQMTRQQEEYFQRLTQLGVLGKSANLGSVRDLLEQLNADEVDAFFQEHMGDKANRARKKIEETYGAEDDFFKIMAYETEKARYAEGLYGAPFADLTLPEQAAVEQQAADIVIATLPNYSKIPQIVRDIQRFPFSGTFVAFPAEMFRVTANQLKLIRTELRDPRLRAIGMRRLLGASMAQAGVSIALTAFFKFLAGVDDREDDAARSLMYEWQQDATILWNELNAGKDMAFVNLSYSDPYAFLKRPVIRMLTDTNEGFASQLGEAAYNFIEPFVSPELTTGTVGQLAFNKNLKTGDEIYNERMGALGDWKATYRFMAWNLQPGIVKFSQDFVSMATKTPIGNRPPKQLEDILLSLPGLQVERRSIEVAVATKIRALEKQKDWARAYFTTNRSLYKGNQKKVDDLYNVAYREYNEVLKDVKFVIESAETLGLTPDKVNAMLKDKGLNGSEIKAARTGQPLAPLFSGYNKPAKE